MNNKTVNFLSDNLPSTIKNIIRRVLSFISKVYSYYQIKKIHIAHNKTIKHLRKKEKIKVAFFLIFDSSWKYDNVYRLMVANDRFDPVVVICPVINQGLKFMNDEMAKCEDLCIRNGYKYVSSYSKSKDIWINIKYELAPDIIFFTNPHQLTRNEYYITNFLDKLTCYVPYSFRIDYLVELQFNQFFHNVVWRNYYETQIHFDIARKIARNKGINVVVSGYPTIDRNNEKIENNSWRPQNVHKKKIIWAPHWTIPGYQTTQLDWSCFLDYAECMLGIVKEFEKEVQFAIKPHPFLINILSNNDLWGSEKTKEYFEQWKQLKNCQINDGEYWDLFLNSDALIHDSGSFMAEYLALQKPALYTQNREDVAATFNDFGKLAFECHYKANSENEIRTFIQNIVVNGNDDLAIKRKVFSESYLFSDGVSASQKIVDNLINQF